MDVDKAKKMRLELSSTVQGIVRQDAFLGYYNAKREVVVDASSPYYRDFLAACKKKRDCATMDCKNKLRFNEYLEMNLDLADFESSDVLDKKVERLTRLWNDPRIALYCCFCFAPIKRAEGGQDERQAPPNASPVAGYREDT